MELNFVQYLNILVLFFSLGIFTILEKKYSYQKNQKDTSKTIISIWLIGFLLSYFLVPTILPILVGVLAYVRLMEFSHLSIPVSISLILSFLILDFFAYLSHRLFHKVSFLWKLHKLHHSETHLKAITSIFHHPLELLFGSVLMFSFCGMFGLSLWAITLYGFIVVFHSVFCHANISIKPELSYTLSCFLVTPAFHRVHHSQNFVESNSNFGEVLTIWDKFFGTFNDESLSSNKNFKYGLEGMLPLNTLNLWESLAFPFNSKQE